MVGLLIMALLVLCCTPAFLATEPGPSGLRLLLRPIRRILVSIDRIEAAVRRQQNVYDSWSRLAGSRSSGDHGTEN